MKILALGDTHGRTLWEQIVEKEKDVDEIVFIGDYFDTHYNISACQQIKNFSEIIRFKKKVGNKVKLLFGNHDFHYLPQAEEQYSGYQYQFAPDIYKLLQEALDEHLLEMSLFLNCGGKPFIFSHAGLTRTWCNNHNINFKQHGLMVEAEINTLFANDKRAFKFAAGPNRDNYGDDMTQGPIWVRPLSLQADRIDNFVQVVGHTIQKSINIDDRVIFIDCLENKKYLIIEDGIGREECLN